MRTISRSSHEDLLKCPRKHFLRYLYEGTGYDSPDPGQALRIGLTVHKGMEKILLSSESHTQIGDALEAMEAEYERLKGESPQEDELPLCLALVTGWYRTKYLSFMKEYEVLSVEEPVESMLSPNIRLIGRCDAVVRSREDGMVYVFNWKTTKSKANWTRKWQHDIQMWTEAFLVQEKLGETVVGCIVEGLWKGYWKEGRFQTPLLYWWDDGSDIPSLSYVRGRQPKPSWKGSPLPSLSEWVYWIPQELVEGHFVRSNPILKNDAVVEGWLREVVRRESDVEHVLQAPLEDQLLYFERRFSDSNCSFCPFQDLCYERAHLVDLLSEGRLARRVDHHGGELYGGE